MEPGDKNEIETMKKDAGSEEGGETGEPHQQNSGKTMSNTDINDIICCNSSTSASNGNNKNNNDDNKDGGEEVTGMEANTSTTNDGRNGEVSEAKVESEKSENSNSSNGRGSSKSKSYYMDTKILKRLDENAKIR